MKRAKRSAPPAAPPPATGLWWRAAVIVIAGAAVYANSLWGPFIFDDFGSVVRNPQIRDLFNWRALMTPLSDTSVAGRPLANLSFAINFAAGGLNVVGYHAFSIGVHLVCGLLIFGLVRRTLDLMRATSVFGVAAADFACAVALLWTVHPLNSEVVSYVTQRTESTMAACYLFTIYADARAARSRRGAVWLTASVLACTAGVFCKETIASAPLMVALYDRTFVFASTREMIRARWRFYAGLAATWLLLAALLSTHGPVSTGGFASAHSSIWTYLLNQTVMITRYLRLVVWPTPLVMYYGWVRSLTFSDVWPYALFLASLLVATVMAFIRRPTVAFGAVWFFVALGPSSSFIPVAAEVGAERRMYIPLIGLITLAVTAVAYIGNRAMGDRAIGDRSGVDRRIGNRVIGSRPIADDPTADRRSPIAHGSIADRRSPIIHGSIADRRFPHGSIADRTSPILLLVVVALLGARTVARNRDYASALTMARTVLAGWPSPSAHQLVGQELAAAGRRDEAIAHLREAATGYPPARYFLGNELVGAGRLDEALEQLQIFVHDEPYLAPTKTARLLMGRIYLARQQWPQAIDQIRLALAAAPGDADVQGLLANVLAGQQAFGEAIPLYRSYIAIRPNDGNAWTGLGVALISTGKATEAVAAFRGAVAADARNPQFHENLARALLDTDDIDAAAREAQQAVANGPNDPAAHEVMGRALMAQGRFAEARDRFERSLQIDPSYAPARDGLRSLPRGR